MLPVRDRCWDPRSPSTTRVTVSRHHAGCILMRGDEEVHVSPENCAALECEPGIASTLAHAKPEVLGLLLVVYFLGTLAWAARWRALLGFAGVDMPLLRVWRVSIEAQAGGILLPGGIGGDALRIASVLGRPSVPGEERAPPVIVVASVLLDRAVGLTVVAALAASLAFVWGGVHAGPLAGILAGIPVAFLVGLTVLRRAPLHRVGWLVEGRVGKIAKPILAYVRDDRAPKAIAWALALSILVAATQFATIRGFIFALGCTPTAEKWVYVGTAMAFIVGAYPPHAGGAGAQPTRRTYFSSDWRDSPPAAPLPCVLLVSTLLVPVGRRGGGTTWATTRAPVAAQHGVTEYKRKTPGPFEARRFYSYPLFVSRRSLFRIGLDEVRGQREGHAGLDDAVEREGREDAVTVQVAARRGNPGSAGCRRVRNNAKTYMVVLRRILSRTSGRRSPFQEWLRPCSSRRRQPGWTGTSDP